MARVVSQGLRCGPAIGQIPGTLVFHQLELLRGPLLRPCELVSEQRLQFEQGWGTRVSGGAELGPPEHDIAHAQSLLLTHRICGFRMGNLTAGKTSTQPWLVLRK